MVIAKINATAGGYAMIQSVIKKVENASVLMFPYQQVGIKLESAEEVVPAINRIMAQIVTK